MQGGKGEREDGGGWGYKVFRTRLVLMKPDLSVCHKSSKTSHHYISLSLSLASPTSRWDDLIIFYFHFR